MDCGLLSIFVDVGNTVEVRDVCAETFGKTLLPRSQKLIQIESLSASEQRLGLCSTDFVFEQSVILDVPRQYGLRYRFRLKFRYLQDMVMRKPGMERETM